jgi:hypothetical protein
MSANLTPEYEKAERRYREAATDEEKFDALQEMLRTLPKHKGTEKMQADLKRRISQFRKAAAKTTATKGTDPFHVPKGGAGQVVLLGAPNAGKSAIVAATTNAAVKVAEYPFATALPVPGMARYEDVQIQLVDTPPILDGHLPPGLLGTIRYADALALVVDVAADPLEQAEMLFGVLDERELVVRSVPRADLGPADRRQFSAVLIANKVDAAPPGTVETLAELLEGRLEILPISATGGQGLGELLQRLWELLSMVRVYTKVPGKPPDRDNPFTLPAGSTIEDLARSIHRDLPEKMKFARIWGEGRFDGQQVHRTEVLRDQNVVEIHE